MGPLTAALASELGSLYRAAKEPPYRQIVHHCAINNVKVTDSSVEEWISGKVVTRSSKAFELVVQFLSLRAKSRTPSYTSPTPKVWEEWRLKAAEERRSARGHPAGSRATSAADSERPGVLVGDLTDPYVVDVHPAIDAGAKTGRLSLLTPYVPRRHDGLLRVHIDRAVDGESVVAALVGESSTGKTRACWEAIARLPDDWRVWRPVDAAELIAVLPEVVPRTVIWLNDAHLYLDTADSRTGEQAAEVLLGALREPSRRPLLVVTTLWTRSFERLTGIDPSKGPSPAERLLTGRTIRVPDEVVGSEFQAMRSVGDPRMVEATSNAKGGRVIQYLAGVPILMERYHNANPLAKAIVHAGMQVRRTGGGPDMSRSLLVDGAKTYLPESTSPPTAAEFDAAFDSLQGWRRGVEGPLVPGLDGADEPSYRLSPYLEHWDRRTFRRPMPPAMWSVLRDHASASELTRLGQHASMCGLWRLACEHLAAAADAGEVEAMGALARLSERLGELEPALRWYAEAAEHGDGSAAETLGRLQLDHEGRFDEAVTWLRRAGELGRTEGFKAAGRALYGAGKFDEAMANFELAHAHGDPTAAGMIAKLCENEGRFDEAIAWFDTAAARDRSQSRAAIACLITTGRRDEALGRLNDLADAGDVDALAWAAKLVAKTNVDVAVHDLEVRRGSTHATALRFASDLLEEAGRVEEGLEYRMRAAAAGDVRAMVTLARDHEESGDLATAIEWYQRAVFAGWAGLRFAIAAMFEAGSERRAIAWLRRLVHDGHRGATDALAGAYLRVGQVDDAVECYRTRHAEGDTTALATAAEALLDNDRVDDAVVIYDELAHEGDVSAASIAASVLARAGRTNEALERFKQMGALAEAANLLVQTTTRTAAYEWLASLGRAGSAKAWRTLGDLQGAAGLPEALDSYRRAAEDGDYQAYVALTLLLRDSGDLAAAQRAYLDRALAGDVEAFLAAVSLSHDPVRLGRYGIEPDATAADKWSVPEPRDAARIARSK